jgi:hypothetical protein
MGDRKLRVGLGYTLTVLMFAGFLAACSREAQRDLPVCPGDPRCETKKQEKSK